ncbi:hypothetical protein niasHT_007932 [Heterodera trifolii]|uniref:Receptor ligand binding region domain-containing protein n=1 Tax=Heterodera trifolii TaxID=157864 RepID=A0ABD2M1I4_9BILA
MAAADQSEKDTKQRKSVLIHHELATTEREKAKLKGFADGFGDVRANSFGKDEKDTFVMRFHGDKMPTIRPKLFHHSKCHSLIRRFDRSNRFFFSQSLDMGPQALLLLIFFGFLLLPVKSTNAVEYLPPNSNDFHLDDNTFGESEKREIQLVEALFFGQPMPLHFDGHSHRSINNRTRRQTAAETGSNASTIGATTSPSANAVTTKAPSTDFKKELKGKVVIRIGHIGAQGAMPNGDRVLEISRMALLEEGILGDELDFDIQSVAACGDSYEGVAVAAAMYHKEKVRAFLGPYCASEFEAVAKMCSFWNIPAISYMPTTTAVSDRNIYKTLARTSSKNSNSIARALIRLAEHYNWKKLAIVTSTGPIAYERVSAFEDEFRRTNTVTVVKKVVLDENWDANEMIRSGLLAELATNARGKSRGKLGHWTIRKLMRSERGKAGDWTIRKFDRWGGEGEKERGNLEQR